MIYALSILDKKFIKIGYTGQDDVQSRIAELQTGCPYELRVVMLADGTLRQEQSLHGALRTAFTRIRVPMPPNEWYPGRMPFMLGLLDSMRFGVNQAIAHAEKYNRSVRQPGRKDEADVANIRWPDQ